MEDSVHPLGKVLLACKCIVSEEDEDSDQYGLPSCSQFGIPFSGSDNLVERHTKDFTFNDFVFTLDEDREAWLCVTGSCWQWYDLFQFERDLGAVCKWLLNASDYPDDDDCLGRMFNNEFNMTVQFYNSLTTHQKYFLLYSQACPFTTIRIIVDFDPSYPNTLDRIDKVKEVARDLLGYSDTRQFTRNKC